MGREEGRLLLSRADWREKKTRGRGKEDEERLRRRRLMCVMCVIRGAK